MQYNDNFEIASLLIMTIILLHFVCSRQFSINKTRIFKMLLFTCMAECCVNMLSSFGLANTTLVPQVVNEGLVFAFFLLEGVSSYLFFRYFVIACKFQGIEKRIVYTFGTIPCILFFVILLWTQFSGFFYYFKEGTYYQGIGAWTGYVYIIYYFVLDLILIIYRYHGIKLRIKAVMLISILVSITMILLQYFMCEGLLTSMGNVIVLLMLYLVMQNYSEGIDSEISIGNESAWTRQLENLFVHHKKAMILTVHLRGFYHVRSVLGIENSNSLLRNVRGYLFRVAGKFCVFRISDDTFVIIVDRPEHGETLPETIRERFCQEWVIEQRHILLDMDMVVQHYPGEFNTISEYIEMREILLRQAIATGRNRILEADTSLVEKYQRKRKVGFAVEKAIQEKAFTVSYQPVYSVREKRIVSLEASIGLQDEVLGFLKPEEFVPVAEYHGNIMHVGEQILESCCKFLAYHVLSNDSLGIRTIKINISMLQCLCQNLAEVILPILERYHIPPSMLMLEFTEDAIIKMPVRMKEHMKELGKWGITFAMEGYGNGKVDGFYLQEFPFQQIKIEEEIVCASFSNERVKAIFESEIQVVQKLGISLVVDGIETREQSEAMEKLGIEYIQGAYYGKSLQESECLRYIRQHNVAPELCC